MTQVSKIPLRKEVENRMLEVLLDSIAMVKSSKDVDRLVSDLLSPTEKVMLAKRLSIALLLTKQFDQRTIAKILRVGLETISKVGRMMKSGKGGYDMVLSSIIKQEKYQGFLDKIDDVLAEFVPPSHRDWRQWRKERWALKQQRQKPF